MKKVLLLIGIIIALTIIVHAETKERREVIKDKPSQEVSSYETLTLMRDIIDIQTRMVKGSENKKSMLRELAQLRGKTDVLIQQMNQAGRQKAVLHEEQSSTPEVVPQAQSAPAAPFAGIP